MMAGPQPHVETSYPPSFSSSLSLTEFGFCSCWDAVSVPMLTVNLVLLVPDTTNFPPPATKDSFCRIFFACSGLAHLVQAHLENHFQDLIALLGYRSNINQLSAVQRMVCYLCFRGHLGFVLTLIDTHILTWALCA